MTPPLRLTGRTRPLALAAILAATTAFAGCSRASSNSGPAALPIATISQRYRAAVDPANGALAAMLKRALAYAGGSTADLDSAVPPTATGLKNAARLLRGIGAPEPLHRDIVDVTNSMNTLVDDLNALGRAKGNDVQPGIAHLVADAGRESAADTLVRLAITQLTSPTTLPAEPLVTSTTLPPITASTTSPRRTTTTRPRTSTSTATGGTSTTVAHTTTTKRATTTTKPRTP
ncbi:MAG: hypothetical protein QOE57_3005 [Acidimicrobiaceae bacterium]|nr:hypothetical protein [Acidimicrobiaceae bacterium]